MQSLSSKARRIWLGIIVLASAFLDFWRLNQNGYGNLYYAAAVKSMTQSFHNFFFVSFDPAGFISVDKPPVGFWIQTVSAWIFGFKGWSILLPEALAGVASVVLLYLIVAKVYGYVPGLVAAALLAITPLSVATNRNNTIDSLLVVALLVAAWALMRALDGGRLKWLLLASCLLGIGFNIKFAEAFLVLPAFILGYACVQALSVKKKLLHLFCAACVLTVVSLSWSVIVDAVPANLRPWVGSTQVNSAVNLAVGYDGVQRVVGRFSPLGRQAARPTGNGSHTAAGQQWDRGNFEPPSVSGRQWSDGSPSGQHNTHRPAQPGRAGRGGVLTLFTGQLASQVGWWLPLAICGLILVLRRTYKQRKAQPTRYVSAVMWSTWLVTTVAYFTIVTPLHTYYMVTMAPAIAAVIAIALSELRNLSAKRLSRFVLFSGALVFMAAYQLQILWPYANLRGVFAGLMGIGVVVSVGAACVLQSNRRAVPVGFKRLAASAAAFSLVAAPAYWSSTNLMRPGNASDPSAGPASSERTSVQAPASSQANGKLTQYLLANYHGGYLVATVNANSAAPLILQTGLPVMAMGGFLGSDPAITPAGVQSLADRGKLKYFLVPSVASGRSGHEGVNLQAQSADSSRSLHTGGFGAFGGQQTLLAWIQQHCRPVPAEQWGSVTAAPGQPADGPQVPGGYFGAGGYGDRGMSEQLYEYIVK